MAENEGQKRGFWGWVGDTLKAAGRKIVEAAKWVADKVVSAAKWVWNSSPVQWLWNTKAVQWVAGVFKTPVGWLIGTVIAMVAAPKVLALVLFGIVLAALLVWVAGWKIWKDKGKPDLTTDVGLAEFLDVDFGEKDSPVTAEETFDERIAFVREMIDKAKAIGDDATVMAYTARLNVLNVRSGRGGKLPSNTRVDAIVSQTKATCLHHDKDRKWDWGLMKKAAFSENRRIKEVERLRAEKKKLEKEQAKLNKASEATDNSVPALA